MTELPRFYGEQVGCIDNEGRQICCGDVLADEHGALHRLEYNPKSLGFTLTQFGSEIGVSASQKMLAEFTVQLDLPEYVCRYGGEAQ